MNYQDLIEAPLEELLAAAQEARRKFSGNRAHVCAIINARSGNCPNDCAFCAQSRHHSAAIEAGALLDNDRLLAKVAQLLDLMPGNIGIVCSGSALGGREFERLLQFIAELDDKWHEKLCLSAGTLKREALAALAQAGLRHYHHNLESCETFYGRICSTQKWKTRRQTVLNALDLGFEVCCGALFGLGESWQDRISLAQELKELGIRNVPLNFLVPVRGTPMASRPILSAEEALRIIAIYRLLLPDAIFRVCGGRREWLGRRQAQMFAAGANALITGNYLTVAGAAFEEDCRLLDACGMRLAEKLP